MPTCAGEDVAFARLNGSVSQLSATLRIEIVTTEACERLTPRGLLGQHDFQMVTGSLVAVDMCVFEGSLVFPVRGAWYVYPQFTFGGREAEVLMPISVSGEAREVTRADWIHAAPAPQAASRDDDDGFGAVSRDEMATLLPFVGIGLAIGLLALAWQRGRGGTRSPRRRREGTAPTPEVVDPQAESATHPSTPTPSP